jgi:methionyl-tRNA synthetase
VTWTQEENWFFRLSRYQDRLLKLLDERPGFIQPESG